MSSRSLSPRGRKDTVSAPASTAQTSTAETDEMELDITVVEEGDAVDALLCSTDNGCDTQKQGDC